MEKASKQGASSFALSTNITLVKKSREIRWAACMRTYTCIPVEKPGGTKPTHGRTILNRNIKK